MSTFGCIRPLCQGLPWNTRGVFFFFIQSRGYHIGKCHSHFEFYRLPRGSQRTNLTPKLEYQDCGLLQRPSLVLLRGGSPRRRIVRPAPGGRQQWREARPHSGLLLAPRSEKASCCLRLRAVRSFKVTELLQFF